MANHCADIVVIGSGFGGSVAANRLALSGRQVLVLERGPWRDTLPVRSMGISDCAPLPLGWRAVTHMVRSVQRGRFGVTVNRRGFFDVVFTPGLQILCPSSVGGGSIAWGGMVDRPLDPGYWGGRHPGLAPEMVEKYYPKIFADLGAHQLRRDSYQPQSLWDHLPDTPGVACRAMQEQSQIAYLVPDSGSGRGQVYTLPGGVQRKFSNFDGDGFLGSPGGTKASVDFIYLAPVLNRGVTVRSLCEVSGLQRQPHAEGGGYIVTFTDHASGARERVAARQVVLAAGTMNTLDLLFRSQQGRDGLAAMPALGRNFGANCDLLGLWHRGGRGTSSLRGMPCLGTFTVAGHDNAIFGVGSMAGYDQLPMPAAFRRRLADYYVLFSMGPDSGQASVSFRHGKLVVHYDPNRERCTTKSALATAFWLRNRATKP